MTRSWQADAVGPPPKRPTLIEEWKAEIAGLRAAWEQAVAERDAAKAELEEWRRDYDRGTRMSDLSAEVRSEINHWRGRAEKAEAEIARLQSDLSDLEEVHETLKAETKRADYWKAEAEKARAALKPDTGETP